MRDGFLKVAAATPDIKVADCEFNKEQIINCIKKAENEDVKVLVFPELCLTGYTCGDLFLQETLLRAAKNALIEIAEYTANMDAIIFIGLPLQNNGKLYNVAAAVQNGKVLGFIPKCHIPNYSEFYEARHFTSGNKEVSYILFQGEKVPFGSRLLFQCKQLEEIIIAAEICEDLWVPQPPSGDHAIAGATLIVNLSASDETTGKDIYRRDLVRNQSARLICGYMYASAGEGESTTDLVFSGHNIIAENGTMLVESERFKNEMVTTEIDFFKLVNERRRMTTFLMNNTGYEVIYFSYPSMKCGVDNKKLPITNLTRFVDKSPFVPSIREDRNKRCSEILNLQAMGLKKRLMHTGFKQVVIGISGGLDSTLALLVASKAFSMLNLDKKGIIAVTMPCFGTTDRTYQNAVTLIEEIGATFKEVRINEAVLLHFKNIGHDENVHDLTFENAQARERTQVLMDIAGQNNAIVVGTGDMSELALGWATYNGDHMSMYGVNASVPKTLVRYLVSYFADELENQKLKEVLYDVLDTPVSPELLPPKEGEISQKTEDIVGPYELHDFFLYYVMRFGFMPSKIYRLAVYAFHGEYDEETILKWLKTFYRRFFTQQFKRSCLPDGPKVGSVAVSPRGDLRMPSDASMNLWMNDLDEIEIGK
ncbi:NAD(+) synthase [Clostridium sp. Marseille-P299]|uniref:NAD(+) synthase n=1 Tax=Clostridium sp. Marseille-P299 TaxID=1805477 RepID=UPI00082B3ECA|nr:NAD(+) synthase [Clostridium sp. Marseille-P299]